MGPNRASQEEYKIMLDVKCKKCKRINQKLFLKGEKCFSSKCPLARKSAKGRSRKIVKHPKRGLSEYGLQMREKQKVKLTYGISERQLANYVKEAGKKKGEDISSRLYHFLEMRLDNTAFRSGFFDSRTKSRQGVSHGHIIVNARKVNIPSCRVKIGDKIAIRPQSASKGLFKDIEIKMKKYSSPSWINLDKEKMLVEIINVPSLAEDPTMHQGLNSIIEFYSR